MTAKEWLGVMQQAENYNPVMTPLIIKYGEMLLAEQSPSTETGQQGDAIPFGKYLAENGWKPYNPNAWENSDDETASTELIYTMFKQSRPASQPQEVGQDEDARNIIADNLYSISDVFGNRLLPQDKCDEMAETFLSDIKSKFTLIKK